MVYTIQTTVFFQSGICDNDQFLCIKSYTPGGGGTPLSKPYRYVPPHQVGFLGRFGLKTGLHFVHFGLESGMVFEGTTGVYERIYCFNSK